MPKIWLKNVREGARGEGGQEATCGPSRGPHGQKGSLPPCGPRTPHGLGDVAMLDWLVFAFSLFHLILSLSLQTFEDFQEHFQNSAEILQVLVLVF